MAKSKQANHLRRLRETGRCSNNSGSSSRSSDSRTCSVGRLPAAIRSCMQRLPAAADVLLSCREGRLETSSLPRAAAAVDGLLQETQRFASSLPTGAEGSRDTSSPAALAAAEILADEPFRVALLRLVAAGLRLAPEELSFPYNEGSEHANRPAFALTVAICCVSRLMQASSGIEGPLPPHVLDFGLKLLRMQSLQALSRQMAEVAASLPQLDDYRYTLTTQEEQPQQQQPQQPRLRLPWDKDVVAVTHALFFATTAIGFMHATVTMLIACTGVQQQRLPSSPSQLQQQLYRSELAAALRDSCVMEHAARLLLQVGMMVGPTQPDEIHAGQRAMLMDVASQFNATYMSISHVYSGITDEGVSSSRSFETDPADFAVAAGQLREVLTGRCAQHAVLLHGLAALSTADGGSFYGLPTWPMESLPAEFDVHTIACTANLPTGKVEPFLAVLAALDPTIRVTPPGRRATRMIALRIARLAVVSAQEWQGVCAAAADLHGTPEAAAVLAHAVSSMPLNAILAGTDARDVAILAMARARQLMRDPPEGLRAAEASSAAAWVAEAAEWWQLVAEAMRHVLPLANEEQVMKLAKQVSEQLQVGAEAKSIRLNTEGALSGGLLPCLERLMRRAGVNNGGPEAAMVRGLLTQDAVHTRLASAVVNGEPRQAAALVATMGKILRQMDPRVAVEALGTADSSHQPVQHCIGYFLAIAEEDLGGEVGETAWAIAVKRRGCKDTAAGPGRAVTAEDPATRLSQLAQLVSCVLWEWAPQLSRLTYHAVQLANAGSLEWVSAGHRLMARMLQWLPLLAWVCGSASSTCGGDGGGCSMSGGSSEWRRLLLTELDAVPLLGSVLQLYVSTLQGGRGTADVQPLPADELVGTCCIVAAACPQQVRQAAVEGSWRPELLRALVRVLRAGQQPSEDGGGGPGDGSSHGGRGGWDPVYNAAELLAAQLEEWRDAGEGGHAVVDEDSGMRLFQAVLPLISAELKALAAALVTPVELRRRGLLRGCGNPHCSNLAGDSEAEVKLKACGRCGQVGYCCRECQVAHWRAGHKEACGRVG
ncbi:hypothetical protein Agub_g10850 [Astrephomene gubernaculifera]|uniref:phytol kinase n=1 Tax=Astrephomene gubernaculifera TaxID=47775 RepID=A0AAD3DXD4_9CHLO|nr:hypothetical protein Agub_g10850 [Astrephomene gubernaculifera]